jgi:hypothetical protein
MLYEVRPRVLVAQLLITPADACHLNHAPYALCPTVTIADHVATFAGMKAEDLRMTYGHEVREQIKAALRSLGAERAQWTRYRHDVPHIFSFEC